MRLAIEYVSLALTLYTLSHSLQGNRRVRTRVNGGGDTLIVKIADSPMINDTIATVPREGSSHAPSCGVEIGRAHV